ncbi:hypothetical protein HB991_05500 [Yersinia mollaretii]|uniref:Uncharacterized protein n=1 Tax=Yersinia mollaretii TaxID=33060 RepID=A0AA44CJQ0_YERMO|nr:hypothetical protein [Yersinia mollaretii]NIL21979.1 hypothetical protein [Yersinia mollaretii]
MDNKRKPPSLYHEQVVARMLENPAVRVEYERLERQDFAIIDETLKEIHPE